MEKGKGGEKKVVAAAEVAVNGGEEKEVVAEAVGEGGERKAAPAPACFTKKGGEDAGFLDTTKDYFKQLQETDADTHWDCIKNRARRAREYLADKTTSMFGRKKVEPEVKGDGTPDVEEGAKPAAPAGGESH